MSVRDRIKEVLGQLSVKFQGTDKLQSLSYWAFIGSLLPIPVVAEAAAIVDRLASDEVSRREIEAIWQEISKTNTKLSQLDDTVEKVEKIATTVQSLTAIEQRLEQLLKSVLESLGKQGVQWTVETRNWSFQAVLNSFVNADQAAVVAINNSHNLLQDSHISANKTHLLADNHSRNIVNRTTFSGKDGTVSMNAVQTQGYVTAEGSGIGFGPGGGIGFSEGGFIGFGPQTATLNCTCPRCHRVFTVQPSPGVRPTVVCPGCGQRGTL